MALPFELLAGIGFAIILIGGLFLSLLIFNLHEKYRDKKAIPKQALSFNFIKGDLIYDSNDFDVIAYAKEVGGGMEWVAFYGVYILKHKTTGTYYQYKYDLEYPDTNPKSHLEEISKERAMYQYLEFKTSGYSLQHYNKPYQEAFDINLKHFGEEINVKKDERIKQPEISNDTGNADFLEIV